MQYADHVLPVSYTHLIKGRPALTQIDHEKVGDFVLITVRDPLCAYDVDPAKKIADRLEHAELIGNSGMFTSYTGTYKGAKITVVSGGSGSPEMLSLIHISIYCKGRKRRILIRLLPLFFFIFSTVNLNI